jgi:hypothetical protein
MDKYQSLRDAGTNGANYDLDTDDVIAHLQAWDSKYGITLAQVKRDAVMWRLINYRTMSRRLQRTFTSFAPT